jgi:acetate kinase
LIELGKVDAIIFTAGIGENEFAIREKCTEGLEEWGIKLDRENNNKTRAKLAFISTPDSRIKILVVPTNEELMIAMETESVLGN